jgi:hypothetical protein
MYGLPTERNRLRELVSRVQPNDPGAVARGPFVRACNVEVSMRFTEIQQQRRFGRRQVTLLHGSTRVARAREVAVHVRAQSGIGGALHRLPLTEF